MSERICSIDGCNKPHDARGWCKTHYLRWRRLGDPLAQVGIRGDDHRRFWGNVHKGEQADGCWVWAGNRDPKGYGRMQRASGTQVAHRISYEIEHGAIPDGYEVDHLCNIPSCVNPSHLEAVSPAEHYSRTSTRRIAANTHCPVGHEYTPENTYPGDTRRRCRTCHKARSRVASQKRRQAQRAMSE